MSVMYWVGRPKHTTHLIAIGQTLTYFFSFSCVGYLTFPKQIITMLNHRYVCTLLKIKIPIHCEIIHLYIRQQAEKHILGMAIYQAIMYNVQHSAVTCQRCGTKIFETGRERWASLMTSRRKSEWRLLHVTWITKNRNQRDSVICVFYISPSHKGGGCRVTVRNFFERICSTKINGSTYRFMSFISTAKYNFKHEDNRAE